MLYGSGFGLASDARYSFIFPFDEVFLLFLFSLDLTIMRFVVIRCLQTSVLLQSLLRQNFKKIVKWTNCKLALFKHITHIVTIHTDEPA